MFETLLQWDTYLLLWINYRTASAWGDSLFPLLTDLHKSVYFYVLVLPLLFGGIWYKCRTFGIYVVLGLVFALATTDFIGGKILKPLVGRDRPNVAGIAVMVKAPHFGGKSFPSNHAANIFTACIFLSLIFRRLTIPLIALAALISFSRVYCGVHYPLDIVGGAMLGFSSAILWFSLLIRFAPGRPTWLRS